MRYASAILTLFLFFGLPKAEAQNNDIFSSYGVDDGLPQSSIWSITQDKNGFLWLGTSDGVCRFDGYNFITYRNNPNDSTTVIGTLYFRFYKDSSGNLWIISKNGISLYNDTKDNFTQIFKYNPEDFRDKYNCFFGEDEQYIWAGVSSCGFIKVDKKTHLSYAVTDSSYARQFAYTSWQCGFISKGKIWISGYPVGCYTYDIKTGSLDSVKSPALYRVVDLNDSELITITFKELRVINKKTYAIKKTPFSIGNTPEESITDAFVASPTEILLTSSKGLFFIDSRTWKVKRHFTSFTQGQKRSYTYAQCVYKDHSGNLWIGTNGDGLKKISAPYKNFKFYSSYSDKGNLVKSIYADSENLFVGYYDNGFDIFNRKNGLLRSISILSKSRSNCVFAISGLDKNNVLLNTSANGFFYRYSLKENRISTLPTVLSTSGDYGKLDNNHPFFQKTGENIYSALGENLVAMRPTAKGITPELIHCFKGEMVTYVYEGRDQLWVGSLNHLYYGMGNFWTRFNLPETGQIKSINQDNDGNTWVATIKGVYVITPDKKISNYYTENNQLPNQFVYGILRDDDGNMWISHNKGLSVYRPATKTFQHYSREDGLQSNEFNTGAYFKSADGELFFGGIKGVNSFYPREIKDNPNLPDVKITSIKLFDLPLKTDTTYWNIHSLTLPYTQNSLSFEFAALEFTNPLKNQYAYMMEGIDNSWINVGDRRFARYAALPPAHYVFKVKACNNDGIWQTIPTTISITIVPPYWQQWWFRLLWILVTITFITGIIIWIQKQKHRRAIRALELQQKIQLERERISRDLHDSVGTQLSLISNNIEWVTHPLKEITENEKAEKLQFVNDTARDIIATLRETIWALNKQQIPLEEFSDKLKSFVQKQFSLYSQITLVYNEQIDKEIILGPSEALNLFRICQEAIANALKYANAATISINVQTTGSKYLVRIADNGKGFDMNKVNKTLQNGIENMKYRTADIDCSLDVETISGIGTRITITKK